MPPSGKKIGLSLAALALFGLLVALAITRFYRWRETDTTSEPQKIARTLAILRSATPTHPNVLKVLFYGQSITGSGWDQAAINHWRQTYPNTLFVVQNQAVGGFPSQDLIRTTHRDIAAFYPDLIIFHDYGSHRAYEQIVRLFRSETAADVILQTDFGDVLPDPPCAEGLQLTLHPKPGCAGFLWVHQRHWSDEMSYHKLPAFAKKYRLAIELQRTWWRDYLINTHTDPNALMRDGVHPNARGKDLMAALFTQYFDRLVNGWSGQIQTNVSSIPLQSAANFQFTGNRLELITSQPLTTRPLITIDDHSPNDFDGCYQVTRATSLKTMSDWPAVRRIELSADHTPEDWTAVITNVSADERSFQFHITGSITGDEGTGDSDHDFSTRSGNLKISKEDWMIARAFAETHIPIQAPFVIHWSVFNACNAAPETFKLEDGTTQYRYNLATGLTNKPHTAHISSLPKDLAQNTELRAYRPPLAN